MRWLSKKTSLTPEWDWAIFQTYLYTEICKNSSKSNLSKLMSYINHLNFIPLWAIKFNLILQKPTPKAFPFFSNTFTPIKEVHFGVFSYEPISHKDNSPISRTNIVTWSPSQIYSSHPSNRTNLSPHLL